MGIKRIVDTSFWTDGKVDEFSPEDKYFMLYLLTNPFSTQLGIYEISIKQVAFQLGYSMDAVKVLIERFENKYDMILYSPTTNEIAIKNFLRHSIIKGGAPVRDCLIKELKKVKNNDLITAVFAHLKGHETLNDTVKNIIKEYELQNGVLRYCNEKSNDTLTIRERYVDDTYNNENENENENDNNISSGNDTLKDTYKTVVSYLNEKTGAKYKATTSKTQAAIRARTAEGFTIDDFKTVIDKKCAEWMNSEWEKYLRPETLFGTKFESYLNAPVRKSKMYGANGIEIRQPEEDDLAGIL